MGEVGTGNIRSRKIHFRGTPLLFRQVVVKTVAAKLDGRFGPQVRAADADDDQHLALSLDFFGSSLDAFEFRAVVFGRQIQPAQKFMAGAGAAFQQFGGSGDLGFDGGQFVLENEFPGVCEVNFDHRNFLKVRK